MNEIRRYRNDREAVSPVIGTILMVAVTVVLAAVLYIVVSPMINPAEDKPEENILIQQGAVTLDGKRIIDPEKELTIREGAILKVGKRRFARIVGK